MVTRTAPQRPIRVASGVNAPAVSFKSDLDVGEVLTGTPVVEEVGRGPPAAADPTEEGTGDLTLTQKAVNTATLTINGEAHQPGEAVQFKVEGGVAGWAYWIRVRCSTDRGQTIGMRVVHAVAPD